MSTHFPCAMKALLLVAKHLDWLLNSLFIYTYFFHKKIEIPNCWSFSDDKLTVFCYL